ncbi:MAG: hypothetical protein WCK13_05560 [Ignavibacteriota bacterium]|nr:hypothetical protein [Ignavibacteriota bacterium]
MIRKLVVSVLVGLLVNLFIGQYSPAFSQYISRSDNNISHKIRLSDLGKSNVLFDSTFRNQPLVLEPISADNIITEFVVGFGLGSAATFLTAVVAVPLSGISFSPGGSEGGRSSSSGGAILLISVLILAQTFATAGGVWSAGTTNKVGADFGLTLLGSLSGVGLEIGGIAIASSLARNSDGKTSNGTLAWIVGITGLLMPAAGAMFGLNTTRYPRRVYEQPKSLLNLNNNGINLSSPVFYIEQDKTFERKPIAFARIVTFNL